MEGTSYPPPPRAPGISMMQVGGDVPDKSNPTSPKPGDASTDSHHDTHLENVDVSSPRQGEAQKAFLQQQPVHASDATYIGGDDGGIHSSVFHADPSETSEFQPTTGLSGSTLEYSTTQNRVVIKDPHDKGVFFSAGVYDGVFAVDVQNMPTSGTRHPDIYPAKLIEHSLGYFESQGHEVVVFEATWAETSRRDLSRNWAEFNDAISQSVGPVTDDIKKAAAVETWTGRLVQRLGFTEVDSVDTELQETPEGDLKASNVYIRFSKPRKERDSS